MILEFLFVDWIKRHGRLNPNKLVLIDLSTNPTISFYSVDRRIDTLSNHLVTSGVKKCDHVAFLLMNSSVTLEMIFACWRIGVSMSTD